MNDPEKRVPLDIEGPAAPPRSNGELLFDEPWEARAFGMVIALYENGLFEWKEFQQQLIAEVRRWESVASPDAEYHYYDRWLAAFQVLIQEKGICTSPDIESRTTELINRPPGHDQP